MCDSCKTYPTRPTKIATSGLGALNCPVTNYYIDGCFTDPDYSGNFPSTCPTSEYRTNLCKYQLGQEWVNSMAGQPLGVVGCEQYKMCEKVGRTNRMKNLFCLALRSYSLCSPPLASQSLSDTLSYDGDKPQDVYYAMCNTCKTGYFASKYNNSPSGTGGMCLAGTMITECTPGSRPDSPTPAPPPEVSPTPAPTPDQSFFERNMEYIAEAAVAFAFILLVVYIFYAKRKRGKKKIYKLQQDAKIKRQSALDKQKLIEMSRQLKGKKSVERKSIKSKLTEEEKRTRRAAKKEKVRDGLGGRGGLALSSISNYFPVLSQNERIAAALDEGLPPGWRSFTDKATGGVYYCHLETGETTWNRPVATKVVEKLDMVDNPMTLEENATLKAQMKQLVDANRELKKEKLTNSKTSLASQHPIDQAKKKKAAGMWKSARAKAKLASQGSAADKMKAMVDVAKAEKEVAAAQAALPKPPPADIGKPPPGPKPGEGEV